jgi:hypothetical protein
MKNIGRQILNELIWFVVIAAITWLIARFVLGITIQKPQIDIHFHDSYFVIASLQILLPLFTFLLFIVYCVRVYALRFQASLPNWIMLLLGIVLIVQSSFLMEICSTILLMGNTMGSPISIGSTGFFAEDVSPAIFSQLSTMLFFVQLFVAIILVWMSFNWGQAKQKNKRL